MNLLNDAYMLADTITKHRRYIHQNAEQHLELPKTFAYVKAKLSEMGYVPQILDNAGIVAVAGGKHPGKTFLLRADMDALPMEEDNKLDFKCTNGCMHACGHDFHASMLLGTAQLLKKYENSIHGQVKLMFQAAEETLSGAKKMIDGGVLENPHVDAAMMIHVSNLESTSNSRVSFPDSSKVNYAAADWFNITVKGKGCHGAFPHMGIDPINVLAHIHTAIQTINAREVGSTDVVACTIGQIHGGVTSNIIPDSAYMTGTLRTTNEDTRALVKTRLEEICDNMGHVFRANVTLTFERGCPVFNTNTLLNQKLLDYTRELLGENAVIDKSTQKSSSNGLASEDFSWISQSVPATSLFLHAGAPNNGIYYPPHHPKVIFDENALPIGSAIYANAAIRWLEENQ